MMHRRFHEQRSLTLFHVLLCFLHLTGLQDLPRDVARGRSVAWNKETAVCLHVTTSCQVCYAARCIVSSANNYLCLIVN